MKFTLTLLARLLDHYENPHAQQMIYELMNDYVLRKIEINKDSIFNKIRKHKEIIGALEDAIDDYEGNK